MEEIDKEDAFDVPPELEDIIEHLLVSLRDRDTVVRWSAAKGVGRITMRLPRDMADDVVGAVLDQFDDPDNDLAWHGSCLALAELARRGLLLPSRLDVVVPLIRKAIHFDVLRGQHSIGQHVRDAASYVCWAFARAYSPEIMKPYIEDLSAAMLLAALFDREINCRRAASAAFQENVGRQGNVNFPLGIEIITIADYFSLGNRSQAYCIIAPKIASMDAAVHKSAVIHLHESKLCHWDREIRELASRCLANMVPLGPKVCLEVLAALVPEGCSPNLYKRHGAVLGLSTMLLAYKPFEEILPSSLIDDIVHLVPTIDKARMYRGRGGELLREASCILIESLARFNAPIPIKTQVALVEALNENLKQPHDYIRLSASKALRQFLFSYFPCKESPSENLQRLTILKYISGLNTEENVAITRGYAMAIGALPPKLLTTPDGQLDLVFDALHTALRPDKKIAGEIDAETRRNCVEAVSEISEKTFCSPLFQKRHFLKSLEILFRACNDYTIDKRGDTGSWSRVAALKGLERIWSIYFNFFSLYPQDPTICSLSPFTSVAPSNHFPVTGCLVLTSRGYGVVKSIMENGMEGIVRFPTRSLGTILSNEEEVSVTSSNMIVISLPDLINRTSNLPSINDRMSLSDTKCKFSTLRPDLLCQEQTQFLMMETIRLVFKQLAEKLDSVREVAGRILERLVGETDPIYGFIVNRQKITRCLDDSAVALQSIEASKSMCSMIYLSSLTHNLLASRAWASPAVAYNFLTLALDIEVYFDAIISGFIISSGGLSEAVVKESSSALLKWCRSKKSGMKLKRLEMLASCFIILFERHALDDRVIVPLMKTTDMLLKNDILYFLSVKNHPFASKLLQAVRTELNKTTDIGKIRLCIEILISLLAFDDPVRPAALRSLLMLVGHRFPKVRKHAADLLYLQLISDANAVGITPSEVEIRGLNGDQNAPTKCGLASSVENLEKANDVLMTTVWDCDDLTAARSRREELAKALGMSIAATPVIPLRKAEANDELTSYSALVRDAGY